MGKKHKSKTQEPTQEPTQGVIQITSTEIVITSNENLNFRGFKIKKGEEIIISDEVFDKLLEEIPNLESMRSKGVIQIVK